MTFLQVKELLTKNYSRAFKLVNSAVESNENSKDEYKLSSEEKAMPYVYFSMLPIGARYKKDKLSKRRYVTRGRIR